MKKLKREGIRMNKKHEPITVILKNNLEEIPNIYDLEMVGSGHDGQVFKYQNRVLKLLKYNIETRKNKNLMTFDKAIYFEKNLILKRITTPIDSMLDINGIYIGPVMEYLDDVTSEKKKGTPRYKKTGDFTCGDLVCSVLDLEEDFNELTKNRVQAKDLNRGSYIYTTDFMHLCDMDKYLIKSSSSSVDDLNKRSLNFVIAKFLYYEMKKTENINKDDLKKLSNWVKKQCNSRGYIKELINDIKGDYTLPIEEYAHQKMKKILH